MSSVREAGLVLALKSVCGVLSNGMSFVPFFIYHLASHIA